MSRKFIALITAVILSLSIFSIGVFANAQGEEVYTDGLYTYIENSDGTVTITACSYKAKGKVTVPTTLGGKTVSKIGERAFADCMDIEAVIIPDGIQEIGEEAFISCMSMASVSISPTVKSIGIGAFSNCTSLNSITISGPGSPYQIIDDVLYADDGATLHTYPAGFLRSFSGIASKNEITTFEGEDGDTGSVDDVTVITTYEIPYGVEKIESKAFYSNVGLTSITVSETVKEIGPGAFACAFALEDIFINQNNQNFMSHERVIYTIDLEEVVACPQSLSEMDFAIPECVTTIWPYAFAGCSLIEYMPLPEGLDSIGEYAFYNCGYLRSIYIPDNVDGADVGKGCFKGCSNLQNVTLSVWMTHLNDYLFEDCTSLTSVTLLDSVETIGKGVFSGCGELKEIIANDFFTSEGGVLYSKDKTELIAYPAAKAETEFVIPDTVTKVRDYAFYRLGMNLSQIVVPSSVKTVGEYAFAYSESLMGIEFKGALPETFPQNALENMGNLTVYYYRDNAQSFAPNGETEFMGYDLVCLDADETPTQAPTETPTEEPTETPTQEPTQTPTQEPTQTPTQEPTQTPTQEPTQTPTQEPTQTPTQEPTQTPTEEPTQTPTQEPIETPDVPKDFIKEEAGYGVTDDGYITKVAPQTKLSEFYANMRDGVDIIIKDAKGETVESNEVLICTGYSITLMDENGNEVKVYTVCVEGDLNGDGKANSRDIAAMQKHIMGSELLEADGIYAADLREDGTVNSRDIAALQKKITA